MPCACNSHHWLLSFTHAAIFDEAHSNSKGLNRNVTPQIDPSVSGSDNLSQLDFDRGHASHMINADLAVRTQIHNNTITYTYPSQQTLKSLKAFQHHLFLHLFWAINITVLQFARTMLFEMYIFY